MPALPGNLASLELASDDRLVALYPTLNQYLPAGQVDWQLQREAAAIEAQETFWGICAQDPAWVVPENPDHWGSILALFTLVIIFRGFKPHESWKEESERWAVIAEQKMKLLRYQVDENRDGEIGDPGEDPHGFTSVPIRR